MFLSPVFLRDEAGTPIIDQITALQIAGSAMFGTAEGMKDPPSSQVKVEYNILYLVFICTLYRIMGRRSTGFLRIFIVALLLFLAII